MILIEKDNSNRKEWSPTPNRNNQRHHLRFDDRRFTERKQTVNPRIDQNKQNFVHKHGKTLIQMIKESSYKFEHFGFMVDVSYKR